MEKRSTIGLATHIPQRKRSLLYYLPIVSQRFHGTVGRIVRLLREFVASMQQHLEGSVDEATHTSCIRCGDELETWGVLGGPPPTFFCACCCRGFVGCFDETTCNRFLVSKSQAMKLYGCIRDDLHRLNFAVKHKPEGQGSVSLYLGFEVRILGKQRSLQRKKRLEALLDISLNDLDPLLRVYLLEDYFQLRSPRRMTLDKVLERYAAMPRVIEILCTCPLADPGAAFDFCTLHPDAGAAEFATAKANCKMVFRLLGDRIMRIVSYDDRLRLKKTPLKDVVLAFENRPGHGATDQ